VLCGLAVVRRRGRLWAAVAGLLVATLAIAVARVAGLPAEPGPGVALGLSVLVASAVRVLPWRQAAGVAAGGLAVACGSVLSGSPHNAVLLLNCAGWLAAVAAGLGPRLLAVRRRAAADRVRRHERLELARELHDVVAHHVTSVVLQAQAARVVARRHPEKAADSLDAIETAGADALAATRHVVGLLREPAAAPPGVFAGFRPSGMRERNGADLAGFDASEAYGGGGADDGLGGAVSGGFGLARVRELVSRYAGPPVRLSLPEGDPEWPPGVAATVYRIVQESLTNVSRHAPDAASVTVAVHDADGMLIVAVTNGTAQDRPRCGGGYGLLGMRERVESLGGTLTAGPRPEGGWSVKAALPARPPR
ncbi:sensor histidine kinase, partial [Nonomuraea terrae]|uniref:sensor histidine kinase n=1 Tax=Nonomuraea terrae TaxID=2530383 RepID=UPI001FE45FA5